MLYSEDKSIRLGGITLPGLIKKLEITQGGRIDEQSVEGSATKPKQPVGYEDAKIAIELILDSSPGEDVYAKLERIQQLFRKSKAPKPTPIALVCTEATLAGVSRVLFKDFKYNRTNKTDQFAATLELWEYVPVVVTATKAVNVSPGPTVPLNPNYQDYLAQRGTAPGTTRQLQTWKPLVSPAVDKPPSQAWVNEFFSATGR